MTLAPLVGGERICWVTWDQLCYNITVIKTSIIAQCGLSNVVHRKQNMPSWQDEL